MKNLFTSSKKSDSTDEELSKIKTTPPPPVSAPVVQTPPQPQKKPATVHEICRAGDEQGVRELIAVGLDMIKEISERDSSRVSLGQSPLISAIQSGNKSLIRYLLFELKLDAQQAFYHCIQDGRRHTLNETRDGVVTMLDKFQDNEQILHEYLALLGPEKINKLNISYRFSGERYRYDVSDSSEKTVPTIVVCTLGHHKGDTETELKKFGPLKHTFRDWCYQTRQLTVIAEYFSEQDAKSAVANLAKNVPDLIKISFGTQSQLDHYKHQVLVDIRNYLSPMSYLHYFAKQENERMCKLLVSYGADPKTKASGGRGEGYSAFDVWPELENILYYQVFRIVQIGNAARGAGSKYCDIEIL